MTERRKLKIFDQMVRSNSILIGLSLILLLSFIAYAEDWFGFYTWVTTIKSYQNFFNWFNSFSFDMLIIIAIPLVGAVFELIYGERLAFNRDKAIIFMGFLVNSLYYFTLS